MAIDEMFSWRGHRIHVTDAGEGEPLVLLAGLGANTDMWAPFIREFPSRRIVTMDAPGTGRSSTPLYPVSIAALGRLAAAVMDELDIESADVVGFSYGGAVAQQFAFDHPTRIRRLVLAATSCGIGAVPGATEAMSVLATPLRYYSQAYFERIAPAVYGGATGRDAGLRLRTANPRLLNPPSSYGYAMQLLAATGWTSWPFLPSLPHETLVICGDDDPLIPIVNAMALANRIPRARLEVVEDAGHLLLWDDAENVATRIDRFLHPEDYAAEPADGRNQADGQRNGNGTGRPALRPRPQASKSRSTRPA